MSGNVAFHLNVELSMSNSFTHMQILNQEVKVIKAVPKFTKNYLTIWKPQRCTTLFLSKSMLWWSLYLHWGEWILWQAGGRQWAFEWNLPLEQFQKAQRVNIPRNNRRKCRLQNPTSKLQNKNLCGWITGICLFLNYCWVMLLSTKIWGECEC